MKKRKIRYSDYFSVYLPNYKLVFNKQSYKRPEVGFASIEKEEGSKVEGILYKIDERDVDLLDKYEGFPKHYEKHQMFVFNAINHNPIECLVYIANPNKIKEGLYPSKNYIEFLKEGKEFLSSKYYDQICKIKFIN